jgi:hypothetical protein
MSVKVVEHFPEPIYGLPISPRLIGNHALDRSQRKRNKCVAASAKFVPRPSHVAPNGCGAPAEIRTLPLRNEKNCSKGRNDKADLGNGALVQRPDRARVPDIAAAVERGIGVEDLAPSA